MSNKMKVIIGSFLVIIIFLGGYFAWTHLGNQSSFGTLNKISKTNDSPEEMYESKDTKKSDEDIAKIFVPKSMTVDENQKKILIDFLNKVSSFAKTDIQGQDDYAFDKTLGNTKYYDDIWSLVNDSHLKINESKITIGASQSEKNKGNAMFVPYYNTKNELKGAVYLEYIPTAESIHISKVLTSKDIDELR